MAPESLFDELGGEPILRKIIDRFVDRTTSDTMIGFFFNGVDKHRLKEKEYEFAARHLGARIPYTGKSVQEAHRNHPIMGGQFMRRLQILKEVLDEAAVPQAVKEHWVKHTLSLQALVTRDSGGRCDPDAARARAEAPEDGEG
jgi:hemoglobin